MFSRRTPLELRDFVLLMLYQYSGFPSMRNDWYERGHRDMWFVYPNAATFLCPKRSECSMIKEMFMNNREVSFSHVRIIILRYSPQFYEFFVLLLESGSLGSEDDYRKHISLASRGTEGWKKQKCLLETFEGWRAQNRFDERKVSK